MIKKNNVIILCGDLHLSSGSYGSHIDYPGETLEINRKLTDLCGEVRATHLIDTGDLTFGNFNLDYRMGFEEELVKQYDMTGGNRITVKGNHDVSTRGTTEWEYYVKRGLLKSPESIELNHINLIFLPYVDSKRHQKLDDYVPNIVEGKMNILITHNFIKFKDTPMPDYGGGAFIVEDLPNLWGIDMIIAGHIHEQYKFKGYVPNGDRMKEVGLVYLGSPPRPAFQKNLPNEAYILCIKDEYDGGVEFNEMSIALRPIEEAFMVGDIIKESKKVDVSDIIDTLESRVEEYIDPVLYISGRNDIDAKVREKAIELYERAME